MSLDTDLLKLSKLIKKFHNKTFDIVDYGEFIPLAISIQSHPDLLGQAKARRASIDRINSLINQLTAYAQEHQMPQYTGYFGDHQLFRLCLLRIDERSEVGDGIFLVSMSTFAGKEIKPGVYHWQHPPAYGYEEPDIICELTSEYLKEMHLSPEQISKIIGKANAVINTNSLTPDNPEDVIKKYKERWPHTEEFTCYVLKVKSIDKLGELNADYISSEFDVEVRIDIRDCTMSIFGPTNNVRRLHDQFKPHFNITSVSSGSDINFIKNC